MRLTKWSPTPRTQKRGRAALFGVLAVSLALSGCGRSAPENVGEALPTEGEPEAAGVQVVSEQAVVVPTPTTPTVPTTVATTVAPPAASSTYVVQPGDTLSVIAEQFGVSTDAISQANGITDVNSIQPGQELTIPGAG